MSVSRRLLLCALSIALSPPASGASEPARFKLISANGAAPLERELRAAGAAGYRVLDAAYGPGLDGRRRIVALMERGPRSGSYDYVVLAAAGDLDDEATRKVNALAAEGYRLARPGFLARRIEDWWLPPSAYDEQILLILTRASSARAYQYASISFQGFGHLERYLADRHREGFEILGLWNSARRLRFVLEKDLSSTTPTRPPTEVEADRYRLLIEAKKRSLRRRLNRAAAKGYRVIAAENQSINAPPMLLLEKTAEPSEALEYRFLHDPIKKKRKGKLERKLRKKAWHGYRVVADAVTPAMLTLERRPELAWPAQYLALSSRTPPGLPRNMERAVAEGFRFVTLLVEAGEATVLLEKLENPATAQGFEGPSAASGDAAE